MKFMFRGRRKGKTFDLVDTLWNDPRAVLLVMHHAERVRIIKTYKLDPKRVMVFSDAPSLLSGSNIDRVLIDNLDQCLQTIVGGRHITHVTCDASHCDVEIEERVVLSARKPQ